MQLRPSLVTGANTTFYNNKKSEFFIKKDVDKTKHQMAFLHYRVANFIT